LDYLVLASARLTLVKSPLEYKDWAYIHAYSVRYACLPIDSDLRAMYSSARRIWCAFIPASARLPLSPHFVAVVLPCDGILFGLLLKVRVDRFCLVIYWPYQTSLTFSLSTCTVEPAPAVLF
jgi:hypothetical protein